MASGAGNMNPAMVLTPQQIAALPPNEQVPYLRAMSPAQQQIVANAQHQNLLEANRQFMRMSVEKFAYCPVSGGSGTTAAYSAGTTLVFDLPVVGSGYVKGLLITYNLTLTLGGTTPVVTPNQAAPFNIFSEVLLNYNGAQCRFHPYILKVIDQVLGYSRPAQNAVIAGQQLNAVDAQLNNGAAGSGILNVGTGFKYPAVTTGSLWNGKIYLRLNQLGEDTTPGILPVMGVGNKPQLKLTCAPSTLGNDPLLNPVATVSGTTVTASLAGTIAVDMIYLDGTTMSDPAGLVIDISAEPTLQYYWDTPLNPLTANTLVRQHIATLLEHWMVVSFVLDTNQTPATVATGLSGNPFINPALTSMQQLELSADSVGQQNFQVWNVSNNISIFDWYWKTRLRYGQDLDPGVVLWVNAPGSGIVDTDNRNGTQVLNMQAGGYPAATHAYLVNPVGPGVGGFTARVETMLVSMNYNGLKIA